MYVVLLPTHLCVPSANPQKCLKKVMICRHGYNYRMYNVTDISIFILYAILFPQNKTQNKKHSCRFVTQMVECTVLKTETKYWIIKLEVRLGVY